MTLIDGYVASSSLAGWHLDLLRSLTTAAYTPGGLDWLGRVTRRYRALFREPILDSVEIMVDVWQGS